MINLLKVISRLKHQEFLILISILFLSCALKKNPSVREEIRPGPGEAYDTPSKKMEFEKPWHPAAKNSENRNLKKFEKKFSSFLSLDTLLDKNDSIIEAKTPLPVSENDVLPGIQNKTPVTPAQIYHFRIQLLAVADLETAQNKKQYYSRLLGAPINLLFDAPFYKLRYGYFKTQKNAQEKVLDLQELGIQGFIVKD